LGLEFLREKVNEEEEAKRLFFEDLARFKQEAKNYRAENAELKRMLGI
jgi:hypothetical protein